MQRVQYFGPRKVYRSRSRTSGVSLYGEIRKERQLLDAIGDVSLRPDISPKKLERAIRSYGLKGHVDPQQVLLLVDNTWLGSAKQGMMLTERWLHAFSNISGRLSIELDDIESVSPQARKALLKKNLIVGMVINGGYFAALPGLSQAVLVGNNETPAIIVLSLLLQNYLGCELVIEPEPDPGPPPWYQD